MINNINLYIIIVIAHPTFIMPVDLRTENCRYWPKILIDTGVNSGFGQHVQFSLDYFIENYKNVDENLHSGLLSDTW